MNVGVLVFEQAEELDFVGPWEMLTMWGRYFGGPDPCLLVAQTAGPVACAKGMSVNPHVTYDDCPPLDLLVVPGGSGTRRESRHEPTLAFIRRQARSAQAVLSVCTGAFVLHAAGLLEGRRATTHWMSLDELRALPGVQVVPERYVRDGPVWTAAGVSAGIDMTLAYIAAAAGDEVAGRVQAGAEYFPDPVRYGGFGASARAPEYVQRGAGGHDGA